MYVFTPTLLPTFPALDRATPPSAQPLAAIHLPPYHTRTLRNGLPVYLLPFGSSDVVEVQVVFHAGTALQPAPGVSSRTARMMMEGTARYSSLALAQQFDGHGAWLGYELEEEALALKIDTVTAKLPEVLPLLAEVVLHPTFPEDEWRQMQRRDLEKLAVNEQKTAFLARRHFNRLLYGADHPYGASAGRAEQEALTRDQLVAYHRTQLHVGNAYLIAAGRFDEAALLDQLERVFGQQPRQAASARSSQAAQRNSQPSQGRHHFERPGMQATVRMGHLAMPRAHPDFHRMTVVNTILGGYFGSRLMKNIREEKGYTYGIGSAWFAHKHSGAFVIQADTGVEYVEPLIEEVKGEIHRLAQEGVSAEELTLVKNYLIGRSLSQRETAFQLGDLLRYARMHDLGFDALDRKFEVLQAMQPEEIAPLVRRYLQPDALLEVVVG